MAKPRKTKKIMLPEEPPLSRRPRAVVVGASSGIGAALARRKPKLDELCAEINAQADVTSALPYPHDVTELEAIPALFQRLLKDLGGIDVFVYCTGVTIPVAIDEFNLEKDRRMIETNLLGAIAWPGRAP